MGEIESVVQEEPRKKRKYAVKGSGVCPTCGNGLRTCFVTQNEGGIRAIDNYGGCLFCKRIYEIALLEPKKIVKKIE